MPSVLIIGANSDIAKACAHTFAAHDYNIILASREKNEAYLSDLQAKYKVDIKWLPFNIRSTHDHAVFYDNIKENVDTVISCPGYLGVPKITKTDAEEQRAVLEINFTGVVSILGLIAKDFKEKKKGTIIGISSVAGDRGRYSNYYYGSAKAGLTAYLSGLNADCFEYGVHVSTVIPGYVKTKMTEGLNLSPLLTVSAEQVAEKIFRKAYLKRKNKIYVKWPWRFIMMIIKAIPAFIFKRLHF